MKPVLQPQILMAPLGLGLALLATGTANAQPPAAGHGEQLYAQKCAQCHDNPTDRVPAKASLAGGGADGVMEALTSGPMKPMAAALNNGDLEDIAFYLTGKRPTDKGIDGAMSNMCPKADGIDLTKPSWNGWSPDSTNTRYQPNPGLTASDVAKLKVKWTFAYAGSKDTQVTVVGNRLFVGSTAGRVYSLNARTGCTYWRYEPEGGVRAAPVVIKLAQSPSGYAVIIDDMSMHVSAVDAMTGKAIWTSPQIEAHPRSMLTASPALYKGVLYVPASSGEEVGTTTPGYICCSFRGSISAVDAATGKVLWKTYTMADAPKPYRPGKPQLGPAGAAVWSSPTVDAKRGLLYIATGDSYTDVETGRADAIMALSLKTGEVKWATQATVGDNWIGSCPAAGGGPANCPSPVGPDHDFGASPVLITMANGKDIVVAGQKSSEVYGLDPDANGKLIWKVKLGRGGAGGGVEWGMASDKTRVYVALADPGAGGFPSLNALDPATGKVAWKVPTPKTDCPAGRTCRVAQSAPVSAMPGVAFSGATDGHLRAYDVKDGKVIWDFDTTATAYNTVNGVKAAQGGALDATGPTFAGGMMFQHSGYPGVMASAGSGQNLLMAFSVDGK
jgi:polyvinyl alcohol dehydrogenase (cytochrome)